MSNTIATINITGDIGIGYAAGGAGAKLTVDEDGNAVIGGETVAVDEDGNATI